MSVFSLLAYIVSKFIPNTSYDFNRRPSKAYHRTEVTFKKIYSWILFRNLPVNGQYK